MQKAIVLLGLLGLALLATGCAGLAAYPLSAATQLLTPNAAAEIHHQTEVRLNEANYIVVKTNAVGICKGFALLGFITIVPAKFSVAMDRFYAKAGMQSGRPQAMADVVMERSSTYWILYSVPQISIRADIIEFIPEVGGNLTNSPQAEVATDEHRRTPTPD